MRAVYEDRGLARVATQPDTLTIPEVARRLNLSVPYTYRAIAAGSFPIPCLRFGKRVMVPRLALERYLERASEPLDAA